MPWVIFILTVFHKGIISNEQSLTLGMNATIPLKSSSLELSCRFSELFLSNGISIRKGTEQVTKCAPVLDYQCGFYKIGYSFTSNHTGVFGIIKNLTREADGIWSCRYTDPALSLDVNSNPLNITVYTIPSGLSFTQVPNMNVDLSVTSAQLQCTTSGCTYPSPLIQWLVQGQSASSPYEVYTTLNPTGTGGPCVLPEQLYTSILDLQQNTTWSDNSDKIIIFSCRIEYLDSSMNVITSGSQTIRFTVRVTEAFLQNNNQNITSILTVTSGEQVTLACVTGTSRPAPSIGWFIGSRPMGSGTSLIFTPGNTDHNAVIFCQAYNIDPNLKVDSNKPKLFVQVRITEAVLQQNGQTISNATLVVTSGKPTILSCVTGNSRPAANIDWYIGSQKRGNGTSLNFIPANEDHDKAIYCQAYNINPNQPVLSNKPILFVRAAPKILDVFPSYKGYIGKFTMMQFDFYSNTDENLTVTAQHSNSSGSIHQGIFKPTHLHDLAEYSQITAPVFRATLAISIMSENDFGQYEIEVTNVVGSDSEDIKIIEQITPEKPINFHATNVQEKQLSLMWQSKYNGGFTQTFVVEISLDNITWNNVSEVSAGNRDGWFSTVIGDLIPGSEYYLRLYAYNIYGRGDFADVQLVIRMLKEVRTSAGIGVGGAVGIVVGGIVLGLIAAIIAFTIRRQLNGPTNSCFRSKGKTNEEMHPYSNTEMNPQTVKPIYEELNKENSERSVYDKISPLEG